MKLISQMYFWNRALHVLDRFSVHHQESSTVWHIYCCIYSTRLLVMDGKPLRNV